MNRVRCLFASTALLAALIGAGPVTAAPADPVIARIQIGHPVFDPGFDGAFAFGALWVSIGNDEIARIDPATNDVVATITVGVGFRHEVAGGNGAIWVTNPDEDSVSRIDPATNAVTGTFPSGGLLPIGVGTTPGAVWVANHHAPPGGTGSVVRLNPTTGSIVETIALGGPFEEGGPGGIAANAAGVWVTVPNLGAIVRIDPATNAVNGSVAVQPCGIPSIASQYVVTPGAGCGGPYLGRVNPTTLTAKKLNPGGIVRFVAGDGTTAWATVTSASCPTNCSPTKNALVHIDLATGDVLDRIKLDGFGFVAIGAGSVWAGSGVTGEVLRVAP